MFTKITAILLLALDAMSVAAHDNCNTGPVQCCGATYAPGNYDVTKIASLVGVAVSDVSGTVGLGCSPITVIGAGSGAACHTSPVCCEKNFQNQLVGVNCSPITAQL
ncbi:unnamed protein product [Cyclocybe aegerita]|uniref:Hydrophobin n=1 Tax=Cyclocybe aegerita TaxID=1973307 RepID=A0A8S0WZ78_CYCAE|nr:unnamed protein product [Cyclocybe aegerita]